MSAMIRAVSVDRKILSKDLDDLKVMLAESRELEEQKQVLPFFSDRPQLWQHIYDTFSQHTPDVVGKEISIGSFFRCDLAGGSRRHRASGRI